jgi:MFS family permease
LFSVYLLAQAVTVPIYGKIADTVGRKPVILFGITAFALGSLLCGLATSMLGLSAGHASSVDDCAAHRCWSWARARSDVRWPRAPVRSAL